jgi:3-hydroxyacyl-CoA dehydrogenase
MSRHASGTRRVVIKTIAVIGANGAGQAFARTSALAGYQTILEDVSREMLERGTSSIGSTLQESVERGELQPETRAAALSCIIPVTGVEAAIRDADLIIETVPEELEMKLELFTIFDKFAKPGAIFASSTVTLSILEISDVTLCRERCIGMRFRKAPVGENVGEPVWKNVAQNVAQNAARKSNAMELVCTKLTSEETVRAASEVAQRFTKDFTWLLESAPAPPGESSPV